MGKKRLPGARLWKNLHLSYLEKAGNETEPSPRAGEQEIPRQHYTWPRRGSPSTASPVACIGSNHGSRRPCPQSRSRVRDGGALGPAPRREPRQDEAQRPMTSTEAAGWGQGAAGLSTPRLPLTPPGLVNRRLRVGHGRTQQRTGQKRSPVSLSGCTGGQLGEQDLTGHNRI